MKMFPLTYTPHHKFAHTSAVIAYFINTLDSQSSGRGKCEPNYFKVEDLF